jgi:small conductance mechanosensitive channel
MKDRKLRRDGFKIITRVLLAVILFTISIAPYTFAQIPLPRSLPTITRNGGRISAIGDVEYTSVYLDGSPLFQIASQDITSPGTESSGELSPVQRRARRIERTLNNIVTFGFDPRTLEVSTATLNNQTVIIASDGQDLSRQVILTVTAIDGLLEALSVEDLAKHWSEITRAALIEAWQARRPAARQRQMATAIAITIGLLLASWFLIWLQKLLRRHFTDLRKQSNRLSPRVTRPAILTMTPLPPENPTVPEEFRQQAELNEKLNLNILGRRLIVSGLILIWFASAAAILYVFPETRLDGRNLSRVPIRFFVIWLFLLVCANFANFYVNHRLREWVEEGVVSPEDARRRILRAPTLLEISRGIIASLSIAIGIVWFLSWNGFVFGDLLTGAGIIGVILTFLFQSLLKDWLNGVLIILEDQYAVGDMIQFGDRFGIVEHMSLRATQLRALDGRSITIPHNQILAAHNLTRDWSRVHFTVEVAYRTDPDAAIEIMKETAREMAIDPVWKEDIIDPVQIIGVNRISNTGIEIMLLIVVQRLRQFDVDREYRRRLKLAFDARGIQIGMPQQSLYLSEEK